MTTRSAVPADWLRKAVRLAHGITKTLGSKPIIVGVSLYRGRPDGFIYVGWEGLPCMGGQIRLVLFARNPFDQSEPFFNDYRAALMKALRIREE